MDTTPHETTLFKELLKNYQAIRTEKTTRQPTYLEIAGKAHKEDVVSNILAFFFDSEASHGLGRLFLDCFLASMDIQTSSFKEPIGTFREITTAKGKRIDLIIESDDAVLIVENKINHWLHNDLIEYAAHANRHYKNKETFLAVLSMDVQHCSPPFLNVTYARFLNELSSQMELHQIVAAGEYQVLLKDFFQTLKNLRSRTMINEQMRDFFIEHRDILAELNKEKANLDQEVSNRAYKLLEKTLTRPDIEKLVWHKTVLVNQKSFPNGLWLKADCVVNLEGYHFHPFVERDGKDESTSELLNAIPYFKDSSEWNVWLPPLAFDTPFDTVVEKMNEFVQTVFQ